MGNTHNVAGATTAQQQFYQQLQQQFPHGAPPTQQQYAPVMAPAQPTNPPLWEVLKRHAEDQKRQNGSR